MQTFSTLKDLRRWREALPGKVGLVPTMGALHAGHLSLARRALAECDHVGVSIFVNPAQFGPSEDLAKYPRTLERDQSLLEPLGVDVVWAPPPEEVYPPGFQSWVTVEGVSAPLEGAQRPGHFRGVTTVVAKLFNAFTPHRAYFGQKDAQQAAVIRRMVQDLNFPLEMIVCPIVREADGLAMSSRNAYLSADERRAATVLSKSLQRARKKIEAGETDVVSLIAAVRGLIEKEPGVVLDYAELVDADSLEPAMTLRKPAYILLAAKVGATRLIDNALLEPLGDSLRVTI